MPQQLQGWDLLISMLPSIIGAVFAGIAMIYGITLRNQVKENTNLTKVGVNKVEEVKSATKDAQLTANAATVLAKRAENKAVEAAQVAVVAATEQNAGINTKLDTVVHALNGGFADKVRQAVAPQMDEMKAMLSEVVTCLRTNNGVLQCNNFQPRKED